jgi:hypothetical protein
MPGLSKGEGLCSLWGNVKLKEPRNRPEGTEGGRGIALLFLDLGASRGGWSAPRPGRFTPGKDPVPIVREAGWTPGPVWMGAENLAPPPGFDPRTVQPVASRYTGWAIPAHLSEVEPKMLNFIHINMWLNDKGWRLDNGMQWVKNLLLLTCKWNYRCIYDRN